MAAFPETSGRALGEPSWLAKLARVVRLGSNPSGLHFLLGGRELKQLPPLDNVNSLVKHLINQTIRNSYGRPR